MAERFLSADLKLLQSELFSDVKVTCGSKTWNLHKSILCMRSVWFEKALTGHFAEAESGHIEITNFEPEDIDCLITYIYTGKCDIPNLKGQSKDRKTNFVPCFEIYTLGDYFNLDPLVEIALSTLSAEFDSRIGPMQLSNDKVDWLDELLEAIDLVYQDTPLCDTSTTPIRSAFINFVHTARYHFLQDADFTSFLDRSPTFALDLFRTMRKSGDFVLHAPASYCMNCQNKPTRGEKKYFSHIGPEKLRLVACCSNCAVKKDLPSGTEDWMRKKAGTGTPS